jgi:hypothetical protein
MFMTKDENANADVTWNLVMPLGMLRPTAPSATDARDGEAGFFTRGRRYVQVGEMTRNRTPWCTFGH